jgi:hypothetical protein
VLIAVCFIMGLVIGRRRRAGVGMGVDAVLHGMMCVLHFIMKMLRHAHSALLVNLRRHGFAVYHGQGHPGGYTGISGGCQHQTEQKGQGLPGHGRHFRYSMQG